MALAATPQVTGIGYISTVDMTASWIGRIDGRLSSSSGKIGDDPNVRQIVSESRSRRVTHWADPIWEEELGASLVTLRRPIFQDDRLTGVIVAGVSLSDLSGFLSRLYLEEIGRAHV